MYAGLFLLPWSVLYGVTAFLFNHPTAFSDQPYAEFGRDALAGTPMESPPPPAEVAEQVVAALRARSPGHGYELVEPQQARYTREFAFAVARAEGRETNVLVDATGAGGSVRSRDVPPPKPEEPAPFAVGRNAGPRPAGPPADRLTVADPLHERVKAAVPAVLERTGFPAGAATVTSVPDLSFLMDADGRRWRVTFNAQTGAVSGRPAADEAPPPAPSTRNFLLRLHTAHGYPYRPDGRWALAVLVDAMAAVLVFWAASGLVMWWQVRAARRAGAVVLVLSAAATVALVFAVRTATAG
jgi:uncharacterized iron-regulated membrane protein